MAISTYAELKTSIANWLDRSDLTDVIPDFIASISMSALEIRNIGAMIIGYLMFRILQSDVLFEDSFVIINKY